MNAKSRTRSGQGEVFQRKDNLIKYLKAAGYDTEDSKHGWNLLGIPTYEGPEPSVDMIESRTERLKVMLGLLEKRLGRSAHNTQDTIWLKATHQKAEGAKKECNSELRSILGGQEAVEAPKCPWR